MSKEIVHGIIIAAVAGIVLLVINRLIKLRIDCKDKRKVYKWLDEFTDENEKRWRSTHAIASHTNLTEDRIINICSKHKKIIRSDKQKEVWGIIGRARYGYFR